MSPRIRRILTKLGKIVIVASAVVAVVDHKDDITRLYKAGKKEVINLYQDIKKDATKKGDE